MGKISPLFVEPTGLKVLNSTNPAIEPGWIILKVNGQDARDVVSLKRALEGKAGQDIEITTDHGVVYTRLNSEGKIGVYLEQETRYKNPLGRVWIFILKVLGLSISLNLGVGLMNLLPLGILDGGRMFEEIAPKYYRGASAVALLLLLVNIFVPML